MDRLTHGPPAVPVVTSVVPASGDAAGGNAVVITGSGFTGAVGVGFGQESGTGMTVVSDTLVAVVSPPGSGTVDVTVTTPAGSPADRFSYAPGPGGAPVVTAVMPDGGSAAGGDTVLVTGSGFTGAVGVAFGPESAIAVNVDSDTQLTAVSPPGPGTVDITVTTPAGTSTSTAAGQFTYA